MSEKLTLRQWRLAREISIDKMAELLGIHPNTYRQWEAEPDQIAIGKAQQISEILRVPLADIFLP